MILQSSPDIEMLFRQDLSRAMAEGIDRAVVQGGKTNEPDGVIASVRATARSGDTRSGSESAGSFSCGSGKELQGIESPTGPTW